MMKQDTIRRGGEQLAQLQDGTIIIAGAHLTAEAVEKKYGDEIRKRFATRKDDERILWVEHGWIRLEIVGKKRAGNECCNDYKKDDLVWFLHEKRKPRGEIVRKATIL
jgi:hypothetical protein